MRHIAIIGAGPAGCYLADQLTRAAPNIAVDVIEKLPVPLGLVRYGVAPDHQATKSVARVLDRVLGHDRVRLFANVAVGRDVTLADLDELYDAVVLATGAPADRRLNIPGEDLAGVVPSGALVGWYNAYPDHPAPALPQTRRVTIIGAGNVAIDVARLLAKDSGEMAGSDLPEAFAAALAAMPIEMIRIVGRGAPEQAKFTAPELSELGRLNRVRPVIAGDAAIAGTGPVPDLLRGFAQAPASPAPITLEFHFGLAPEAFLGAGRLEAVRFRAQDGPSVEFATDLAVTCIGYHGIACCAAESQDGVFAHENGRIRERLYAVGWAARGPSGTIPTNRAEAQNLAKRIAAEVMPSHRPGADGLRGLLAARDVRAVDHAGWRRVDACEQALAGPGRCRRKLDNTAALLEAAGLGGP